mgnify:FL=1
MKRFTSVILAAVCVCLMLAACGAKVEFTPLDEGDVTKVYRTSTGEELDTEAYRKAYNESTVGEEASPSDVSGSTDMILFILSDGKTVPVYVMGENEFIIGSIGDAVYYTVTNSSLYDLVNAQK